jgi:hypothetical protein
VLVHFAQAVGEAVEVEGAHTNDLCPRY